MTFLGQDLDRDHDEFDQKWIRLFPIVNPETLPFT